MGTPPTNFVHIDSLRDFNGTLAQLKQEVDSLCSRYSEYAKISFNHVSVPNSPEISIQATVFPVE